MALTPKPSNCITQILLEHNEIIFDSLTARIRAGIPQIR